MRIRTLVALAGGAFAAWSSPLAAQRTGDRAQLVFTISGGYISGRGLWTVPAQPVPDVLATDTYSLSRSVKSAIAAGLSATYYRGASLGLNVDLSLIDLGYDDRCRIVNTPQSTVNVERCASIDSRERGAAAAMPSVGLLYRVASREFISPFVRAGVGLVFSNQSPLKVIGENQTPDGGAILIIYDDDTETRVRPAFALGVGATVATGRGIHLRWEIRDNILGIEQVTGPTQVLQVPPHRTAFKHLFTVLLGIDVLLERQRGRRY